jgi:hypothetical protein
VNNVSGDRIERAAYLAANLIESSQLNHPEYASAGVRRSRRLDEVAKIIKEVFIQEMREMRETGAQTEIETQENLRRQGVAEGVRLDHEVARFSEITVGTKFAIHGDIYMKSGLRHAVDSQKVPVDVASNTLVRIINS